MLKEDVTGRMKKIKVVQQVLNPEGGGGVSAEYRALIKSKLSKKYEFIPIILNGSKPGVSLHDIKYYFKKLKKVEPDIIHVRGATVDGLTAIIAAKLRGRGKILVTVHGMYSDMVHINLLKKCIAKYVVEPLSFTLADGISCVYASCANRKCFKPYRKKMLPHVYNRIPDCSTVDVPKERISIRKQYGIAEDAVVGVFCGRITKDKGLEYLVQAINEVIDTHPHLEILIVGSGDYLDTLKDSIQINKKLQYRVFFTGEVNNVFPALAASDFFIFPSLHENHSIALLEAMAMKLPTIATKVGGNPEIVHDNQFGILVEAANVAQLKDAINEMCNDVQRKKFKCAIEAYSFDEFKADNVDMQLDQVYQRLLGTK